MSYSPSSSSNSPSSWSSSSSEVVSLHVELALLLCGGVLVLLILGDEIVHVTLCFCEFHFVHSLACVPVQESLAAEHSCEELCHTLEHFLNCCGIPSKGNGHFQTLGRNVAHTHLDVVRNPLHEITRVLVLNIEHLFIDLLG